MLKETVIAALEAHFRAEVTLTPSSRDFASFDAKHPEVGNVVIEDDGMELTVSVGNIHHSHFASYKDNLSEEEHAGVIAANVVSFLTDLFDDKYLLYKSRWGGGWSRVEDGFKKTMLPRRKSWYKWSGPVHPGDETF
ncbi:MAG: hypothetical protein ABIU09_09710 [Pyrinomonadaceae bacterium]